MEKEQEAKKSPEAVDEKESQARHNDYVNVDSGAWKKRNFYHR